ncbi:MAG: SDR family oxidoreductase [Candidatus Thiodiazotropha sp. (ex. Lucinoma kazani)]
MNNPFSVTGKRVVITGGTSGMGLAAAKHLVEHGASVVICGRRDNGLQIAEEIGAAFIKCDVSDHLEVKRFIEEAAATFDGGKIDALFLNAGYSNEEDMLPDLSYERMRKLFKVNFDHVYAGIHYAVPYMAEYSSIAATISPAANTTTLSFSAYSPSKAATKMLCRTAAIELAPNKIRVNSINPGAVITGMQYPGAHDFAIVSQLISGEIREASAIAPFFHFLTSDASRPMTGAEFTCDDGISAGYSLKCISATMEAAYAEGAPRYQREEADN